MPALKARATVAFCLLATLLSPTSAVKFLGPLLFQGASASDIDVKVAEDTDCWIFETNDVCYKAKVSCGVDCETWEEECKQETEYKGLDRSPSGFKLEGGIDCGTHRQGECEFTGNNCEEGSFFGPALACSGKKGKATQCQRFRGRMIGILVASS